MQLASSPFLGLRLRSSLSHRTKPSVVLNLRALCAAGPLKAAEDGPISLKTRLGFGAATLGAWTAAGAGPATAEEVAADPFAASQVAAEQLAGAPAPDDPVITIMFSIALVALSVVTLGVSTSRFRRNPK